MKVEASFVRSAAAATDFPRDGWPAVALVGRSNVGKSSLINALVRQRVARTSRAPGKTRLANIYRVVRGSHAPLYLVDLPGYGYARGGGDQFETVIRGFFGQEGREGQEGLVGAVRSAVLLVDARHPGLDSDRAAWRWLRQSVAGAALVATKTDKLSRAPRQRAKRELEAVFEHPVLPVSAVTGEGLDELWILIDTLARLSNPPSRRNRPSRDNRVNSPQPRLLPRATAPRPPKR